MKLTAAAIIVLAASTSYASAPSVEQQMTTASRQPGMPNPSSVKFVDCGLGISDRNEDLICCRIVPK